MEESRTREVGGPPVVGSMHVLRHFIVCQVVIDSVSINSKYCRLTVFRMHIIFRS